MQKAAPHGAAFSALYCSITADSLRARFANLGKSGSQNIVGFLSHQLVDGAVNVDAGSPFQKVGGGDTWECVDKIYDTQAMADDQVLWFDPNTWDISSFVFAGYVGDVPQGWSWTHIDSEGEDATWETISEEVSSFTVSKGMPTMINMVRGEDQEQVTEFTVAGEVLDTTKTAKWEIGDQQYKFIMNPFPIDTTYGDLETFMQPNDLIYIFSTLYYDVEYYQFLGEGKGWAVSLYDPETWMPADPIAVKDPTAVILPAGMGGIFQQEPDPVSGEFTGRTWEVSLGK